MEIVIKNAALEKFFAEVADAFYSVSPEYAEEFGRWTREASRALIHKNGMSEEGHFMALGNMPPGMYHFIKRQARKRLNIDDIWRDSANMRLFFKVWEDAAFSRKTAPRLYVSGGKPA